MAAVHVLANVHATRREVRPHRVERRALHLEHVPAVIDQDVDAR